MSDIFEALPQREEPRFVDLDEAGLRQRLADWTTGATDVIVPVRLLDRLVADLDEARERATTETARRKVYGLTLRSWGVSLVGVAESLGVVVLDRAPARAIHELRTSQLLLDTLLHWGLR